MARTLVFSAGLGALIAWNWGRLEEPRPSVGALALMVTLGVAPALLLPLRLRFGAKVALLFAAEAASVIAAAAFALHVHRPYHLGRLVDRAGSGFVDFYDVLVPFNGAAHPLMHGVLLLAVCVFTLLCALAVAARRPLTAILALAAGAGWPATILPGSDDLGRGAFLLAAALALVAWLRPENRRAPPQILAGTALVVLALIVSSSGSVAKGQFIGWQNWDLYTKPGKRVGVEYVWRSDYNGVRFPKKRTRVFTVRASERSVYWRATTLDAFTNDLWDEDLISVSSSVLPNPVVLTDDPLVPAAARNPTRWTEADVTIDALRDAHLVGPSQPISYDSRSVENVQYEQGGVALAFAPLARGDEYSVWAYTPRPTPAELAKSAPDYPIATFVDRGALTVSHGVVVPAFGSPEHKAWADEYFRSDPDGQRYRPLYNAAERTAGKAQNPYAAAVALEAWLRSSGGFTYDEQPPTKVRGIPALVQFVSQSKRGYCQHFAGAMALMLRYLGIPARVAAGFTSGNYDSRRGTWTVYDRNAHTWVEVWFKGYGWLPFDPTPGRGTLGGSYTSSSVSFDAKGAKAVLAASALEAQKLLGFELSRRGQEGRARSEKRGASTPDRGSPGRTNRGRGTGAGGLVALGVALLALLFVLAKLALRRSRFFTNDPRLLASACRRELVDFLLDQGIDVPRNLAPRELGRLLRRRVGIDASDFAEALGLARFGPEASAPAAAREARRELRSVRRGLRRTFPIGRRARGLFSFRSVLAGR